MAGADDKAVAPSPSVAVRGITTVLGRSTVRVTSHTRRDGEAPELIRDIHSKLRDMFFPPKSWPFVVG